MNGLPVGFPLGSSNYYYLPYSTSPPTNNPVNTAANNHTTAPSFNGTPPSPLKANPAAIRSIARANENKRQRLNEDDSTPSSRSSSSTPVGSSFIEDEEDDPIQDATQDLFDKTMDMEGFVNFLIAEEISVFEDDWLEDILNTFMDNKPLMDVYIVQLLSFPNPTNNKTVMHCPELISIAMPALEYLLDAGKVDDFMKLISIQDVSEEGNTPMHHTEIFNTLYPLLKHKNVTTQNITELIDLENKKKQRPGSKDQNTNKSLEALINLKLDQALTKQ